VAALATTALAGTFAATAATTKTSTCTTADVRDSGEIEKRR